MAEMMISGTVMIGVVFVVRRLTFGKISMGLRYALWLAVALRLMLPFHFGSSPYSIMSGVGQISRYYNATWETAQAGADHTYAPEEKERTADHTTVGVGGPGVAQDMQAEPEQIKTEPAADALTRAESDDREAGAGEACDDTGMTAAEGRDAGLWFDLRQNGLSGLRMAAVTVWIIGMVAVGGFMLSEQVRFIAYLHRVREEAPMDCLPEMWRQRLSDRGLRVWLVNGLPGPCMAGRGIYISPELYGDGEIRLHILAHEYVHAVQRDTLWAVVRSALCVVWWFYPPVWLAAYAAKQDSELACDEQAVRLLGETERFSYGRTLLALVQGGHDRSGVCGVVLSMDGSSRQIRQRISVIADTGKRSKIAAGIVALTVLLLCGCAYTGAKTAPEQDSEESVEGETAAEQGKPEPAQADQVADMQMTAEVERSAAMRAEEEGLRKQEETAAEYSAVLQEREEMLRSKMEELAEEKDLLEQEQERRQREMEQMQRQIQEELEQIEAEWMEVTSEAFSQVLAAESDEMLESAVWIDRMEYFDYLYNDGPCPMEDGMWYLIHRDERYGIDFYGFYTDKYGSRGVKMLIDGDVNTLDIAWRSAVYESGIEVSMIEQTRDGLPRTFAFTMCTELTSEMTSYQMYLVDRYDTGTIDFYTFDEEACRKQFQDMVDFRIDPEQEQILLLYKGDVIKGGMDISAYRDYTVEDVFWDGSWDMYYSVEDIEFPYFFVIDIGLKVAETDEIQYENLERIICPVSIGAWGDRSFTVTGPYVEIL